MKNENKIPIKNMIFVALLAGFIITNIKYRIKIDGDEYNDWINMNYYMMKDLFNIIFSFFTIYVSYTFERLKFKLKETLNKFIISNFGVCITYCIVSLINNYNIEQLNNCLFRYLFLSTLFLIVCRIEHKFLLKE